MHRLLLDQAVNCENPESWIGCLVVSFGDLCASLADANDMVECGTCLTHQKKWSYEKRRWPTGPLYSVMFVGSERASYTRTCSKPSWSDLTRGASTKVHLQGMVWFFEIVMSGSGMLFPFLKPKSQP